MPADRGQYSRREHKHNGSDGNAIWVITLHSKINNRVTFLFRINCNNHSSSTPQSSGRSLRKNWCLHSGTSLFKSSRSVKRVNFPSFGISSYPGLDTQIHTGRLTRRFPFDWASSIAQRPMYHEHIQKHHQNGRRDAHIRHFVQPRSRMFFHCT